MPRAGTRTNGASAPARKGMDAVRGGAPATLGRADSPGFRRCATSLTLAAASVAAVSPSLEPVPTAVPASTENEHEQDDDDQEHCIERPTSAGVPAAADDDHEQDDDDQEQGVVHSRLRTCNDYSSSAWTLGCFALNLFDVAHSGRPPVPPPGVPRRNFRIPAAVQVGKTRHGRSRPHLCHRAGNHIATWLSR